MGAAMEVDDPSKPEFASWHSYTDFAKRVHSERRYATDAATRAFIATVLATAPKRETPLAKGRVAYRAQIGVEYETQYDEESGLTSFHTWGLSAKRMTPEADKVGDGRANPVGVAFLYLASSIKTAISEVRPWIRSEVSVAAFEVTRDLQLINVSPGHGGAAMLELTFDQIEGKVPVDAETKRKAVWTDIDSAFSLPVTRGENSLEYVPTQILAEAFRNAGYDGVAYRSQFGDPGYNIALFDLTAARPIACTPYEIKKIEIEFAECGNTWYATKDSNLSDE